MPLHNPLSLIKAPVFVLYGPAGSGKSTTLFELVQLAKALGIAVLYIPNGKE
jgi:type II secretory ATPase GspE/PulE/Tfp pilus assembly ATPase PilB-like protein